jgi:hypothetical protein
LVDNGFGLLGLVLGDHWGLEEPESKELGSRLFRVFQCFPVKLENNPETLEKVMAVVGLLIGMVVVCGDRFRLTMQGKKNGLIEQSAKRETGNPSPGKPESVRHADASPGETIFDDGGAIRSGNRFEASLER